jgi:hypothetical protein
MQALFSAATLALGVARARNEASNIVVVEVDDNEILSRLKFIGKIKRHEKINTKYVYAQPDTYLTSLSRTFLTPDTKDAALHFVKTTIQKSFLILERYENEVNAYDCQMKANLLNDLRISIVGLMNLKDTYKEHVKVTCDMDTLIQQIKARLGMDNDEKKD